MSSLRSLALLLVALTAGCSSLPRTRTPMPVLRYPADDPRHSSASAPALVVLLPGRKDRDDVFQHEGLIDVIRQHGLAADLAAADAHAGYYVAGSLVRQLHDELIGPARRRGARRVVMVGVSLGGYGAVRYAMIHPGDVDTLVLLSPFLGAGPFMRELAEAGDEDFAQTWAWLKAYPRVATDRERRAAGYPRIVLGYGHEDMFLRSDVELRELLPPSDAVTAPGAHLWSTWRLLLQKSLEAGLLDPPS